MSEDDVTATIGDEGITEVVVVVTVEVVAVGAEVVVTGTTGGGARFEEGKFLLAFTGEVEEEPK